MVELLGRYQEMIATIRHEAFSNYSVLAPDDDPVELVALTRLQVPNTLLLVGGLLRRGVEVEGPSEGPR
ncbi:hypothetical protein [Streptosporangium canum]|uniref:hypothetical protein n=1 Tax=Streptosporangium canum TaxID=324952 RepID=UPI00378F7C40